VTRARTGTDSPGALTHFAGEVIVRSLVSRIRSGASSFGMAVLLGVTLVGAASAGPYTRLQVLLPGESAAPGTPSGKSGAPIAQTSGVPFQITVRACDDTWATVAGNSHTIQIQSTDASATLPVPAQLVDGTGSFTVRFNASGVFTVIAHDQTDPTIPDANSAPVQSLVLQGFVFSTISQKHFTAGTPENMTIRAVDPQGNTVTGFQGVVRLKETTSFGDGRAVPDSITLVNGTWTGGIAALRADETNINRGNCNFYAWLASAESKNGTSDPFVVHPAGFARVQLIVPGEAALPGSVTGKSGTPSSQSAGQAFAVSVWSTDAYWNPIAGITDNVQLGSSDGAASTPGGALVNGFRQFDVTLNTVGTQTITVDDVTNGSIPNMTSPGIAVQPNSVHHFVVENVGPQTAGVPAAVTIRATDVSGNTIPTYTGDVNLAANTGPGSITPERVTISNGVWLGNVTFKGAGNNVLFTVSDFAAPPHTGVSNSFIVSPGPLAGLQVLLPGETASSGEPDGRFGTPAIQSAGNAFNLVVRAVDAYWNLVPGINHRVAFASTDSFAIMPSPDTTLADGQRIVPVRLHKSGPQTITVTDLDAAINSDTSTPVTIVGGTFARVLILAPGEFVAPGTATGRAGDATDQSIDYSFNVTVLATDNWWNPVGGVSDVVRVTCSKLADLPPDTPLANGRADLSVRLRAGGFSQITVEDVTNPAKTGSWTEVNAISSGFHLEASVAQDSALAGQDFSLTVKVTNDAGAVIQEINSLVTLSVIRASTNPPLPGRGQLTPVTVQLLQGQATVNVRYTYAEEIQIVANDDANNDPATTLPIVIKPGVPHHIAFSSSPPWVGGNKHAALTARVLDQYENGVPNQPVSFARLTGTGTLTQPANNSSDAGGFAYADFLSPRQPEFDLLRVTSNALTADLNLQTAFVDPNAGGGHITNYPNPFHPPAQGTTLAWKLDDNARVRLRIFTLSGDLVFERSFPSGGTGGVQGLNEWVWDGRNGAGRTVSSGGYVALLEAQGSATHIMRRKLAVVR
jgi:hypothetical protein